MLQSSSGNAASHAGCRMRNCHIRGSQGARICHNLMVSAHMRQANAVLQKHIPARTVALHLAVGAYRGCYDTASVITQPCVESCCAGNLAGTVLMTSLQVLDLHGNAFSGTLPAALGSSLSELQTLDLSNNLLSGSVPSGMPLLVGFHMHSRHLPAC